MNNQLLTRDILQKLLEKGNIQELPSDLSIFQTAFVHKSYITKRRDIILKGKTYQSNKVQCPKHCVDLFKDSNERLEFLGDSILGSIIVSYLYQRFPHGDEGFLTNLKSRLVNSQALAEFCKKAGLGEYLVISEDVENKSNGRNNTRLLEDLFEAFIGAMYLSFQNKPNCDAYSICQTYVHYFIETLVDFEELIVKNENYKDLVSSFMVKHGLSRPTYQNLAKANNEKGYRIALVDKTGKIWGKSLNKNKKKAEQMAAKLALETLKEYYHT